MTLAQKHSVNDKTPTSCNVELSGNSAPRRSIHFSKRCSFLSSWARKRCAIPVQLDRWRQIIWIWHCYDPDEMTPPAIFYNIYNLCGATIWQEPSFWPKRQLQQNQQATIAARVGKRHRWVRTTQQARAQGDSFKHSRLLPLSWQSLAARWAMEGVTSRHQWMFVTCDSFLSSNSCFKMREVFEAS